jgi:hypothetical protein
MIRMLEKTPSDLLRGAVRRAGFVEDQKLYIVAQIERGTNPLDAVVLALAEDPRLQFDWITSDLTVEEKLMLVLGKRN